MDELINPQSYATKVVKQGTLTLGGASQPGAAKISGLTSDGSYYLSTVLVDARGDQSPLKVISFTTPDNSVPNFATDYPYLSRITNISAQVTAMTTKTCRLYWALLPKGSAAPTASDFKANAVTGNLGFGTLDVTKNTPYTFDVNSVAPGGAGELRPLPVAHRRGTAPRARRSRSSASPPWTRRPPSSTPSHHQQGGPHLGGHVRQPQRGGHPVLGGGGPG